MKKNYTTEFRKRNPQKYIYHMAKSRAKENNLDFDIEPADINIPEYCPILGIKLNFHLGVNDFKTNYHDSPSLDRIDNSKGYVKGNILVMSKRANYLKSNMTKLEVKLLYDFFCKYFPE